jgi:hypothetical protein
MMDSTMHSMMRASATFIFVAIAYLGAAPGGETAEKTRYGPRVIDFEDLAYPAAALAQNVQGVVVTKVTLDDDGNILDVSALSGRKLLIPDCLANLRKWKFQIMSSGERTAIIVFDFEIKEGQCHDASRSLFQRFYSNLVFVTACTAVKPGR